MKVFFTTKGKTICLALLACGIIASAQRLTTQKSRMRENAPAERVARANTVSEITSGAITPVSATHPVIKASADIDLKNEVLLDEDFSQFAAGSEEAPDEECLCVLDGTAESPKIDAKYTKAPGWTGGRVYQAGGMAALIPADQGLSAVLNSPYMDYSGNLTITFRMKSIDPTGRTFFFLNALRNGINNPKDCVDKDDYAIYFKYNLTKEEGWKEFTVELNNCSADGTSFIQFNCAGQALLDDLKVVAHNDFIAAPFLRSAKDFTYDGFTATWDKMRRAESYEVNAFYKKYSDKESEQFTADFENGVDKGFTLIKHGSRESNIESCGSEGSKALILEEGDTLVAPCNNALIHEMQLYLDYVKPEDAEWDYYSCLNIQGYDPKTNRWYDGGVWCEDLMDDVPGTFDCETHFFDFNDWFQMVRLIPENLPEGAYVVVDNINITTNRPFEYVQDGDTYTTTDNEVVVKTSHPEETYFYSVKSHLGEMEGASGLIEAIGVATPHLKEATDIDERGSYTANWEAAPRASGYILDNFGVFTADKDTEYALLSENFDKIDDSVTEADSYTDFESLGNYAYSSLNDYTAFPGWVGINNVVSRGMIGCAAPEDMYAYLYTPLVCAADCQTVNVRVKAYGKPNDWLMICNSRGNWGIPFNPIEGDDKNAMIDGTFEIPVADINENFCLMSFNSQAFLLDEFAITRDLKEGQKAQIYIEEVDIQDAATTSHTFDNLDGQPYTEYAYTVTSYINHEDTQKTYMSNVSDMVYVLLSKPDSVNSLFGSDEESVTVFDLNGRRVRPDEVTEGVIYLVKKGNTVRKVILTR